VEIGLGYSVVSESIEKESTDHVQIPIQSHQIQTQVQPDDYFQSMQGSFTQANGTGLVRRQQFTVGDVLDQSRNSSLHYLPSPTTIQQSEQLPFGLIDILNQQEHPFTSSDLHIYNINISTPETTPPVTRLSTPPLQLTQKHLSPTFTYNHDEPTFARRLIRSTLERGFQLLNHAHVRPSRLNYVFRLCLPYLTLDQLRTRFKRMLSRHANEDFEMWETPFIHLGGAGTHYPRKDTHGNILPRRNTWTIRPMGPLEKRLVRMENVADGRWEFINNMDLSAFDGEWFDAYDVQGYLEEKWGCRIYSKSSFVECAVDVETTQINRRLGSSDEEDEVPALVHSDTNSSGPDEMGSGKSSLLADFASSCFRLQS
jgi:hypothetical protein